MTPTVSVIIPALNEQDTVASVVDSVLAGPRPVEEILVIDADSRDDTAARARSAGARVLNWREILPALGPIPGKGESLWRGVAAARGELVVFMDADLVDPDPSIVARLVAPFEEGPGTKLVKASYRRGFHGAATGGGRVTELAAKPLLRAFFPELGFVDQPLAGEYAIRREQAVSVPFVAGYGVEMGLLIDVYSEHGAQAITQVPLPDRVHRNRPLSELGPMAEVVAATVFDRAGVTTELSITQRPSLRSLGYG